MCVSVSQRHAQGPVDSGQCHSPHVGGVGDEEQQNAAEEERRKGKGEKEEQQQQDAMQGGKCGNCVPTPQPHAPGHDEEVWRTGHMGEGSEEGEKGISSAERVRGRTWLMQG